MNANSGLGVSSPIAVSGLGCVCAAGADLAACLDTLFAGRRAPAPPTRFSTTHPVRYPVFELPPALFEHPDFQDDSMLLTAQLTLHTARQALAQAGLSPNDLAGKRVGVCVGTTVGSAMNNEQFYREYKAGGAPDMAPITRFLRSNPAAVVARELGLRGPVQTVVNACSSGADAIGIAAGWLESGLCDLALAGGADELCRTTYNGFISLMITDEAPCRPFDVSRKGLNLGEGAAMLCLERDAGARATPQGYVLGYGTGCDAHHLTAPHPDGRGLRRAVADALQQSGLTPENIAFVNAHGTGTQENDKTESKTLHSLLPDTPFCTTKGYTGHTLGAAGALEAAFTLGCLQRGAIPPNVGFVTPDPELPATPVQKTTEVRGAAALSQSLAFGGGNAVLCLGV